MASRQAVEFFRYTTSLKHGVLQRSCRIGRHTALHIEKLNIYEAVKRGILLLSQSSGQ
jgi:hypothetical protein